MYNEVINYVQFNLKRKNFQVQEYTDKPIKKKTIKKITKQRLKNIALFYLKRFESSVENLRQVLKRRTNDYAFHNPEFNKNEAYTWIEEILADFEKLKYIDDNRYAELKIRSYLSAGKPERYIKTKLQQKGISANIIENILAQQSFNPLEMALKLAKKKKIGPYRKSEAERKTNRQKDLATLIRAGFDYDIASEVINLNNYEEDS